jgi:hypothetical protein
MMASSQPIRITIPASVAYDLKKLQDGLGGILDKLGCMACCSGFDITLLQERNFVISENLEINQPARSAFGPFPEPWLPQDPVPCRVIMPVKVSYNLEQVQDVLARVAGKLGCEACCSGFDIAFMQERNFLVDEALNIRSLHEL